MTDELSAPLGNKRRKRQNARPGDGGWRRWPWARIGLALLGLGMVFVAGWVIVIDDPTGGRPIAEAPVSNQGQPNPVAVEVGTQEPAGSDPVGLPATGPGGPSIITLGEDGTITTSEDRAAAEYGALPGLVESTQLGLLPRIGADGLTPFEAYARPSLSPNAAGGRALIGVVMTGLGLNETSTRDAIEMLPGTVTLAFAPYGQALVDLTAQARAAGHELMLEVPLEPFDYPQNDPGPHTLLVEHPPRENLEKLYWLLSRMGGYTGLINHMGARFTASAADFGPVMEEIGIRGLGYLDNGTSARSVAPQLAAQNDVPFARVDMVLDENPSRTAILQQLDMLEAQASERGWAIATISALPVSIRTLSQWAESLDEERMLIVPVSALATTPD
ncbi:divergent polysaccharide deacetylase family protein [Pelagibacterium xiamenense]|uniref:divergent polysaccharide deacetylase family protein n=1 Tax=Pelagibacterium xiamenense TaxID=2901140 RepID=UPI001E4D4B93|nr:divergent polysaccharide deacetylase family protein [Pelagibacterium xiamenense]MCD7061450.1 divergent polysaccharide deacetylase family protein [Pelagibacterium xiamenense]